MGYLASSISFNPSTLTGGATPLTLGDDDSVLVSLPFTFTLYGLSYTDVYVGSNGLIGFDNTNSQVSNYDPQTLPDPPSNTNTPGSAIFGFWMDFNPPNGGTIKYETFNSTPNRIFVVDYNGVFDFQTDGTHPLTMQIKLFESDKHIEIHTTSASSVGNDSTVPGAVTQGIQNLAGTQAAFLAGRNLGIDLTLTNDAVKFEIDTSTSTSTSSSSSSSSITTSSSSSSSVSTSSSTILETIQFVGADSSGDVQAMNANYSDDGSPIFYEVETQELEFSDRAHLKNISDQLTVVTRDGLDSQLQAREDDGDYKNIPMKFDTHASIGKNINLKGKFFTFRWFGQSNKSSPVLEEILIDNIEDKGITNE